MSDQAAAEVVVRLGVTHGKNLVLSAAPAEFRLLSGRGVSISTPGPQATWDEDLMHLSEEQRTAVSVDVRSVLAEGVRQLGFSVTKERDGYLVLNHAELNSSDVELLFAAQRDASPLKARAASSAPFVFFVHAGTWADDDVRSRDVLLALGVDIIRLSSLSEILKDRARVLARRNPTDNYDGT